MNKKDLTQKEIEYKIQNYCSYQERCHLEVYTKLKNFTSDNEEINQVISKLIDDGYLNETRFSKEFTIGKFNHKNWGRIRINRELKKRKISQKNIQIGLDQLNNLSYEKKLGDLFEFQLNKYKQKNDIYTKKKIFDYLNYRGWEKDLIFKKINSIK